MSCSVTDLILLVGINPLPNYVVARYFLKRNRELMRIWLVHSERNERLKEQGTLELAKNIRKVLEMSEEVDDVKMDDVKFKLVSLSDISDAKLIKSDIKKKLIQPSLNYCKDSSFHLNYTGGKKTMAVHVYRALETEKKVRCTFSYLDAREFRLKDDEEGYISDDLRKEISISLDSLMKLHNYEKDPEDKNQGPRKELDDLFTKLTVKIKEMIDAGKIQELLEWVNSSLRRVYFDPNRYFNSFAKFKAHNKISDTNKTGESAVTNEDYAKIQGVLENKLTEEVRSLLSVIPLEYGLLGEEGRLIVPGSGQDLKRLKPVINDFLAGKWLEQYTPYVLKKNINGKESLGVNPPLVTTNWKIVKKNNSSKKFEIDVIVINGYQICGISCTTSQDESICKEKGFEVLHRVGQIGGGEAKAVLITCMDADKVEKVQYDLRNLAGATEDKFLVLSINDLKEDDLWKKLSDHIWGDDWR